MKAQEYENEGAGMSVGSACTKKNAPKWVFAARTRRRMCPWYYLKCSPCALKQSELRGDFLVRFLEVMRKSDECMKNGKRKTFLSIPRNATAKKKSRDNQEFLNLK